MDKDKMLQRADDLLKFILDGLEQGKEFAMEQAPLVVKEVITWGIVSHAVGLAFSLLTIAAAVWALRKLLKEGDEGWAVLGLLCGAPGAVMLIVNLLTMLKAIYAPRLYLLTELKDLLR